MRRPLIALLAASLALSACGGRTGPEDGAETGERRGSMLNPLNWFGGNAPEPVATLAPPGGFPTLPEDRRPVVRRIVDMQIRPTPGGVILYAVGLPTSQGWWDADLVADNDGEAVDGRLSYAFVVMPPFQPMPAGEPRTREVTAARFIPGTRLEDVRRITVRGVENEISRTR